MTWLWTTERHSEVELALVTHDVVFQIHVTQNLNLRVGTLWAGEDGESRHRLG